MRISLQGTLGITRNIPPRLVWAVKTHVAREDDERPHCQHGLLWKDCRICGYNNAPAVFDEYSRPWRMGDKVKTPTGWGMIGYFRNDGWCVVVHDDVDRDGRILYEMPLGNLQRWGEPNEGIGQHPDDFRERVDA